MNARKRRKRLSSSAMRIGKKTKFSFSNLWKNNWIKRVILGCVLVIGFTLIIWTGPLALLLMSLGIQLSCFNEIITIGYKHYQIRKDDLLYFRTICWYFVLTANYFCFGETVTSHFTEFYRDIKYLRLLITYHRFVSFCMYLFGIILFIYSLVRKYNARQFRLLAWTHTLLIIIVVQSYMIIQNIFEGIIWYILPASLVILNDIYAYIFGRLWGRTPLIRVSPKKTWEGFIGGAFGTLFSTIALTNFMCRFDSLVCENVYVKAGNESSLKVHLRENCERSDMFTVTDVWSVWPGWIEVAFYPFLWHSVAFAVFASLVAPFGGFCASGFKRAMKVKDFGDVLPGHGGLTDRFDCQFLMLTFVNVYIFTFVKQSVSSLSVDECYGRWFHNMNEKDQLKFYNLFRNYLKME